MPNDERKLAVRHTLPKIPRYPLIRSSGQFQTSSSAKKSKKRKAYSKLQPETRQTRRKLPSSELYPYSIRAFPCAQAENAGNFSAAPANIHPRREAPRPPEAGRAPFVTSYRLLPSKETSPQAAVFPRTVLPSLHLPRSQKMLPSLPDKISFPGTSFSDSQYRYPSSFLFREHVLGTHFSVSENTVETPLPFSIFHSYVPRFDPYKTNIRSSNALHTDWSVRISLYHKTRCNFRLQQETVHREKPLSTDSGSSLWVNSLLF